MEEKESKLRVVSRTPSGRSRYDKASKRALVEDCLRPGVSVARKAQENGINANLLRKWIARYLLEREQASGLSPVEVADKAADLPKVVPTVPMAAPNTAEMAFSAFVPLIEALPASVEVPPVQPAATFMTLALHVHLPNGVQFDLAEANLEALSNVVQMLGRLPCSGSTKG